MIVIYYISLLMKVLFNSYEKVFLVTLFFRIILDFYFMHTFFAYFKANHSFKKIVLISICFSSMYIIPMFLPNLILDFFNVVNYRNNIIYVIFINSIVVVNPLVIILIIKIFPSYMKLQESYILILMKYVFLYSVSYTILFAFTEPLVFLKIPKSDYFVVESMLVILTVLVFLTITKAVLKILDLNPENLLFSINTYFKNIYFVKKNIMQEIVIVWAITVAIKSITYYFSTLTQLYIYMIYSQIFMFYMYLQYSNIKQKVIDHVLYSREKHISVLNENVNDFRGLEHDFLNMLQIYDGYFEVKDYKGLEEYHRTFFNKITLTSDKQILIDYFKDKPEIYGLLMRSYNYALQENVTLYIKVHTFSFEYEINDVDFCRLFGILINNAIEEARNTESKYVTIFFENVNDDDNLIIIQNSTIEAIDTGIIFSEGYTTKNGHKGHGLSEIVKIIKNNPNVRIQSKWDNYVYSVYISITN